MPAFPARRPVLYVEDHPAHALLMAAILERRGQLRLVVAPTGSDALRIAADLKPVLLLVDLNLPDCHGRELLPRLRALPGCESVPAVAVTAETGFDIGGTGFCELWAKPLALTQVLARLDQLGASAPAQRHLRLPAPAPFAPLTAPGMAVPAALP